MLYQITDGTLSLEGKTILNHIDFEIRGKEKIAVTGQNGAGKTTLLRLIAGELTLDRDDRRFSPGIFLARNTTVGMLHQNLLTNGQQTVEEELLSLCPVKDIYSRERYDFEQEYDRIFTGLGFTKEEKKKKLQDFSGGERTKIAMIKLFLQKPDILLLDEPTNHLDIAAVEWMEDYIRNYEKAVVLVSHDRFFLDQTVHVVYELEEGKLCRYAGNYTEYRRQREKKRKAEYKNYREQQKEIIRLTALIEKFKHKPKKAAMARSKKKVLERMQILEKPSDCQAHRFTDKIVPAVPGSKTVLETEGLRIGYDQCLKEITLRIRRGQKIGIIGANGSGKTTFIRTITGQIPALGGTFRQGNHVRIGYFDQHSAEIVSTQRVWEHFHDHYPALTIKEVKTILGNYLFSGENSSKKVSALSGGEKSRLVLAEILEARPNFLVLDEPTNHMDLAAKETLESAFNAYEGTMLFISHDRYFLKEVADSLLIFNEDTVTYYPFGYVHYLQHLERKEQFGWAGAEAVAVENSLLVQGLSDVPEKKRMQSPRFSTEQSYADWQLALAGQELARVKKELEDFLLRTEEVYLHALWDGGEALERWTEEYRQYEKQYAEECLCWYEKWMAYEDAFIHYQDS